MLLFVLETSGLNLFMQVPIHQKYAKQRCAPRSQPRWTACTPSFNLNIEEFLRTSWGQTPVVVRGLIPGFISPISPDELAGLSCMPEVEARIITGSGPSSSNPHPKYTLQLGPFDEEMFESNLSDSQPWTLLVHEVNRWNPHVAKLLDYFAFLPNWRVDDVMVSYATVGGGVGPHVDNYDVFLVQGAGARRWRFRNTRIPSEEERLLPDSDVRILDGGFEADDDLVLYPGDCLYLPPRYPHWGESLDNDCITYSVGFRAPTVADLVSGWAEHISDNGNLRQLFLTDEIHDLVKNRYSPGRISDTVIDAAYHAVLEALKDSPASRSHFSEWFCEEISSPKRFREIIDPADDPRELEANAQSIVDDILDDTSPTSRHIVRGEGTVFAFRDVEYNRARLYVDGEIILQDCAESFATFVSGKRERPQSEYADFLRSANDDEVRANLAKLFAKDLLYFSDGDEDDEDLGDDMVEEEDIDD